MSKRKRKEVADKIVKSCGVDVSNYLKAAYLALSDYEWYRVGGKASVAKELVAEAIEVWKGEMRA